MVKFNFNFLNINNYFMNLLDEKSNVKVVTKPQYIHEVKDDIMAQGVVKK